jgi:hypothetical protein
MQAEAQQPQEWRSRREPGAVEAPHAKGPNVPEGQRLPRATDKPDADYGGIWSGVRGDSDWFSDVEAVNKITNYEPIPFRRGFPNFSKWAKARVFGKVTGNNDIDFAAADDAMAKQWGFASKSAFEGWRVANKLTWHHVEGMQEQQLIPFDLNDKVPHVGGAAQARGAKL